MTRDEILTALNIETFEDDRNKYVDLASFDRLLSLAVKAIEINERNHNAWYMDPTKFIEGDRAEMLSTLEGKDGLEAKV